MTKLRWCNPGVETFIGGRGKGKHDTNINNTNNIHETLSDQHAPTYAIPLVYECPCN